MPQTPERTRVGKDWLRHEPELARRMGRLGGKRARLGDPPRTAEWRRGYEAGWKTADYSWRRRAKRGEV